MFQPTSTSLWNGIADRAKELNVNLITINGERIGDNVDFNYNSNILYKFINKTNIDGIITWASSIGTYISKDELKAFHDSYKPIPTITLSIIIDGYPSILVDNYNSMKNQITHLVKDHGYKKIGFIRGPENYYYAEERLRAYKDALSENGINIEEELITEPSLFNVNTGIKAVSYFIDELKLKPKKDIDAIVGVSDEIAIITLKELQNRGIKIPQEIALVGFNNNLNCKTVNPALTSIDIYFHNLGKIAVEKLIELINGNTIDDITVVPSKIYYRESCGCVNKAYTEINYDFNEKNRKENIINDFLSNREYFISEIKEVFLNFFPDDTSQILSIEFIDKFFEDIKNKNNDIFINYFRKLLISHSNIRFDFFNWESIITKFYNLINSLKISDCHDMLYFQQIIHQSRITIQIVIDYYFIKEKIDNQNKTYKLLDLGQYVTTNLEINDLVKTLNNGLQNLNIEGCYIFIYEDEKNLLKKINNVFAYDSKSNRNNRVFKMKKGEYIPEKLLKMKESLSLVVMSLYFKTRNIGYIIYKHTSANSTFYHSLKGQISSCLESIITINKLRESQKNRIDLYENIKEKNNQLNETMKALWGEMELAKKLQTTILPERINIPGYKIDAFLIPAEEIKGAFYDIIDINEDSYWINIGDVTGKGVTVGLILMMIQTCNINTIMHNPEINPDDMLNTINKVLYYSINDRLKLNNSLTSCYIKFNKNGDFYHSGLHEKILIFRADKNEVEEINTFGAAVGVREDIFDFISVDNFKLNKNDLILLYTKGLILMKEDQDKKKSMDQLKELLKNYSSNEPDFIIAKIVEELYEFKNIQTDDIALVLLKKE
ncbi:MAG: substrate-binding domain-containing protein [Spirochaetes bacterium]|nr:substrate-binding domain-containing protein [Spirochaetota bacterium]